MRSAGGLAASSDGKLVYLAGYYGSSGVYVIDLENDMIVGHINVQGQPYSILVRPS